MEMGTDASVVHPQLRPHTTAHTHATEHLQASRLVAEHALRQTTQSGAAASTPADVAGASRIITSDPKRLELEFEWRKLIHAKLLETMDLRRHDVHSMSDERLRQETEGLIRQILKEEEVHIPQQLDCDLLCKQVLNEAIGLGPLEELLEDDSVTEIMVNRFDEIYVERFGKLEKYPLTFTGDRAVMGVIERTVAPLGRRIDESSPMRDDPQIREK